jgi:cytochrome c biogenesis protein CcmG/thiol:disulfide interchange protein DsbE
MKPQHVLPLAIFLAMAVAFGAAFYLNLDPKATPFAIEGKLAPSFDLPPALDGTPGLSSADLKGQVTIVNFFASWCAPCHEEHPVLMQLAQRTGVAVVGIDYKDKRQAIADWFGRDGNPFSRVGFDQSGRVFIDWGLSGVPETFVVDKSGNVVWRYQGALNDVVIAKGLEPMLESLK